MSREFDRHFDAGETDDALIDRANEGDVDGFTLLYERYKPYVLGLAWRWTGDREVALDVMQEAFVWLLEQFPGFVLQSTMKTVLYHVVRNEVITRSRRDEVRRRHLPNIATSLFRGGADGLGIGASSAPEEKRELIEQLARALDGMPEMQREVLLLRFVDGLTLKELAMVLDVPVGTVKSRLHHALAYLREAFVN